MGEVLLDRGDRLRWAGAARPLPGPRRSSRACARARRRRPRGRRAAARARAAQRLGRGHRAAGARPGRAPGRRAGRARIDGHALRGLGVVLAGPRRVAARERRRDRPDGRPGRALRVARRRARALLVRVDRLRGGRAPRHLRRGQPRRGAELPQPLRALQVRGRAPGARARAGLPAQVLRPSIVVGDSRTGWTSSFNVLYPPLRAFAHGAIPALPARRAAPVDVVPVDYVADSVHELSRSGPTAPSILSPGATRRRSAG